MSVVAWDGKTLSADKQATSSGLKSTVTKIRRAKDGSLLAWVGCQNTGVIMADWYDDGADLEKWPKCQENKDDWAVLVIVRNGALSVYEQWPKEIFFEDPIKAFGSGRDYALGAMAMGADSRKAVEIAMRFESGCGMGVDTLV